MAGPSILGPTGHNFAAGMSGGIAWVHDPDEALASSVNAELVDLEPVAPDDEPELLGARHRAPGAHRLAGRGAAARELGRGADGLRPRDPARVRPRPRPARADRRAEDVRVQDARGMSRNPRAFMEIRRVSDPERNPAERVRDYDEIFGVLSGDELRLQGARCMDCGVPFCNSACPLGNLIPDWNDLVRRGDWRDACEQLHATNNFPEFTGLICPAPCESACVLAIDDDPVMIKQIEYAIVHRGFEEGWIVPRPPERRSGQTVAVVGSGPAGLAAAAELNQVGHTVTVYERDEATGGLMRFGVPDAKLEKWMIDRRVELLEGEGVRFECGVEIGADLDAPSCRTADNDAVVIAIGSRVERDLEAPGRELAGVHFAMDYLYQRNRWVARSQGRPAPEPAPGRRDHRGRQARGRDRRRRHRHGLRLEREPRGGALGDPARRLPRAPGERSLPRYAVAPGAEALDHHLRAR